MYGHVSTWRVSLVTAMNGLVNNANTACVNTFNEDISAWDVSAVTTFDQTFYTASAFDQDLSAWDVSKASSIGSLHHTFYQASALSDCNKALIHAACHGHLGTRVRQELFRGVRAGQKAGFRVLRHGGMGTVFRV